MSRTPDWVLEHQRNWEAKASLRHYYREEIFARIVGQLVPGRTLELGCGPGFFTDLPGPVVRADISPLPAADVCADAHRLPFRDSVFANVVGVDVLHHFARPAAALAETARVLEPGGRLVLVEPWTGLCGIWFYRLVHHEGCHGVPDPWMAAMPAGKDAMEGNTAIPKILLVDRADELAIRVPGLRIGRTDPFGSLSSLMTGGFQRWGFPLAWTRLLCGMERRLPRSALSAIATRVLYVLERKVPAASDCIAAGWADAQAMPESHSDRQDPSHDA